MQNIRLTFPRMVFLALILLAIFGSASVLRPVPVAAQPPSPTSCGYAAYDVTTATWVFLYYGQADPCPCQPGEIAISMQSPPGTHIQWKCDPPAGFPPDKPGVDAGPQCVAGTQRTVKLNPAGGDSHEIQIQAGGVDGAVVGGSQHTFSGLQAGVAYHFRGQSYNSFGGSGWSAWAGPVYQDTSAPITDISTVGQMGTNNWWQSNVSVSLLPVDQGCAGLQSTSYTLDGTTAVYAGPFFISGDGTHTLTYASTDGANVEPTQTQTFQIDTTPPSLSLDLDRPPDAPSGWWQGPITVTVNASDATSGLGSQMISVDGGGWQVYAQPITFATDGTHSLDAEVQDKAGNVSVDGVVIPVDGTPPQTTLSMAGTPGENGWYVSPSVEVTLTASDATSGVFQTLISVNGGVSTYTSPVTVTGEGIHTVEYGSVDVAANIEAVQSQTIKIDTVSPSISFTPDRVPDATSGWWQGPVTVTVNISDATSGIDTQMVSIDGGAWQPYTQPLTFAADSMHSLDVEVRDNAGNVSVDSIAIPVDATPPQTIIDLAGTPGENGWYVSPSVDVTLTASDATSGVFQTLISVDGVVSTYTSPVTVAGEGIHLIEYGSVDVAANIETVQSQTIKIDTVSPSISFTPDRVPDAPSGWWQSPVTVTVNISDATSGIDTQMVSIDGGAWQPYTQPLTFAADSMHSLDVEVRDNAGNVSVDSIAIPVDATPPQTIIDLAGTPGENGWYVSPSVDVTLTASDATSGVFQTLISVDGVVSTYTSPVTVAGEGIHLIEYGSVDVAANIEAVQSQTIKIDTVPPQTEIRIDGYAPQGSYRQGGIEVSLHPTDATSGVMRTVLIIDGKATLYTQPVQFNSQGHHTIQFLSVDWAGNREVIQRIDLMMDNRPPGIRQSQCNTGYIESGANHEFGVNLSLADNATGIQRVRLFALAADGSEFTIDEAFYNPAVMTVDRLMGASASRFQPGTYRIGIHITDGLSNLYANNDLCTLQVGGGQVAPPLPQPTSAGGGPVVYPPSPTRTRYPSATPTVIPTSTSVMSGMTFPPPTNTLRPSSTPLGAASTTATITPTGTRVAASGTPSPTNTLRPSSTPTSAASVTATASVTPSVTSTTTLTPTPSNTPIPYQFPEDADFDPDIDLDVLELLLAPPLHATPTPTPPSQGVVPVGLGNLDDPGGVVSGPSGDGNIPPAGGEGGGAAASGDNSALVTTAATTGTTAGGLAGGLAQAALMVGTGATLAVTAWARKRREEEEAQQTSIAANAPASISLADSLADAAEAVTPNAMLTQTAWARKRREEEEAQQTSIAANAPASISLADSLADAAEAVTPNAMLTQTAWARKRKEELEEQHEADVSVLQQAWLQQMALAQELAQHNAEQRQTAQQHVVIQPTMSDFRRWYLGELAKRPMWHATRAAMGMMDTIDQLLAVPGISDQQRDDLLRQRQALDEARGIGIAETEDALGQAGNYLNSLTFSASSGGALPPGDDIASLPKDVQKLYWRLGNLALGTNTMSQAAKDNCGYYQYLIRTAREQGDMAALTQHIQAAERYVNALIIAGNERRAKAERLAREQRHQGQMRRFREADAQSMEDYEEQLRQDQIRQFLVADDAQSMADGQSMEDYRAKEEQRAREQLRQDQIRQFLVADDAQSMADGQSMEDYRAKEERRAKAERLAREQRHQGQMRRFREADAQSMENYLAKQEQLAREQRHQGQMRRFREADAQSMENYLAKQEQLAREQRHQDQMHQFRETDAQSMEVWHAQQQMQHFRDDPSEMNRVSADKLVDIFALGFFGYGAFDMSPEARLILLTPILSKFIRQGDVYYMPSLYKISDDGESITIDEAGIYALTSLYMVLQDDLYLVPPDPSATFEAFIDFLVDPPFALELAATILFEPLDWAYTFRDLSRGEWTAVIGLIPFIPGSAGGAFLEWMAKNADQIPVGQVDEFLTILSRSKNLGDDVVAGATDMLRRANAGIDEFGNKLFNNRLNPAFAIPDGGNIPNSGMLDNAVAKMDGSADNFANKGDDVVQETTEKTAKEATEETAEQIEFPRTQEELDDLAYDPATERISNKTRAEREVGLNMERSGDLKGPITRDPIGAGEFFDGDGQLWDIKSYHSGFDTGFNEDKIIDGIRREFAAEENVIINTMNMSDQHIRALKNRIESEGLDVNRIKWYYPE